MAVELFVWLYIMAFALASVIAITLLVTTARRLGREDQADRDKFDSFEQ
jgi:hypothetical protein